MNNGVDSKLNIGSVIDNGRRIAGADAKRRLARRIGGVDHTGATGSQDNVGIAHNGRGKLNGWAWHPIDNAFGAAGLLGSITNNAGSLNGAALCAWVRRDEDGVARLEREK